jgi:Protein of unknown function (DUF3631)
MIDATAVEPMPPDDSAELLDALRAVLTRYVVFADEHSAVAVTLWVATTHALPAFEHAPRLVLTSPQKRCAKSRTLDIISGTCHNHLMSVNATVAAIYRSLGGEHPPTLIIDEADALFGTKRAAEQNEDLRALLNAGHQRGRPALRCVGPNQIPTEFPTFAMAALAGIGSMPDTITDRAVNITMRRRASGEKVAQFRSRRDAPVLAAVRDRLAAWAAGRIEVLARVEPTMPVEDRAADTWEPLIAVADEAGGHWSKTARAACVALVKAADEADEDKSLGVKLLVDIRQVFAERGGSFLSSTELIEALRRIEESPWGDFDLSSRKLAKRLKEFGVSSARNAAGNVRGYRLEDLSDVFARYIRSEASEASETSGEQPIPSDTSRASDTSKCQTKSIRQNETLAQTAFLTDLTLTDASSTENGSVCRFCSAELPEHMTSQRARGYCHRPACIDSAKMEAPR